MVSRPIWLTTRIVAGALLIGWCAHVLGRSSVDLVGVRNKPVGELSVASASARAGNRTVAGPATNSAATGVVEPAALPAAGELAPQPTRGSEGARGDFDLMRRLFYEATRITAQDLIHHVDLNPRGATFTADDIRYLESILATYAPDLARQEADCGRVQSREMDALIAGGLAPSSVAEADASGRIRFRAVLNSETLVLDVRNGVARQYDAPFASLPATRHAMHAQAELCFQLGSTLVAYFASLGALTPGELAVLEARLAEGLAGILRM